MTISTNRLFFGTVVIVIALGGGTVAYQWEEKRVRDAYTKGVADGTISAGKVALKVLDDYMKSSDAALDHMATECRAAINDVGHAAARARALADLTAQPREPVEIVIRRKCGQLESPYIHNCVQ